MTTYRIFLASSAELADDRTAFELFIGRENKRLSAKNVTLQVELWEDAGQSLARNRSQDEYDGAPQQLALTHFVWFSTGKVLVAAISPAWLAHTSAA